MMKVELIDYDLMEIALLIYWSLIANPCQPGWTSTYTGTFTFLSTKTHTQESKGPVPFWEPKKDSLIPRELLGTYLLPGDGHFLTICHNMNCPIFSQYLTHRLT
jgi:hypothetical protein